MSEFEKVFSRILKGVEEYAKFLENIEIRTYEDIQSYMMRIRPDIEMLD